MDVVERRIDLDDNNTFQLVTVKRNRGGVWPRERKLGKEIFTKSQFLIHSGDFLISKRQIVHGACGLVPDYLDGAVVSNEYAVLKAKNGLIPTYVNYLANSIYFQQTCFQSSIGVAIEKMVFKLDEWLKRPIYLPPLPIQKRIVSILGAWDNGDARVEELRERLIVISQALSKSLLNGSTRFPGFSRSSSKGARQTKYGKIPHDWKIVRIQDIARINDCSLTASTDPKYEFIYLDLSAVKEGAVCLPNVRMCFQDAPSRARRVIKPGDVLMSTVRPNLNGFAIVDFDSTNVICSTGFAVISVENPIDARYIHECLYSEFVLKQIHERIVGSNYPALNEQEVGQLWVPYPSDDRERNNIGNFLTQYRCYCELLRRLGAAWKLQKDYFTEKLLTGQLPINVKPTRIVEAF